MVCSLPWPYAIDYFLRHTSQIMWKSNVVQRLLGSNAVQVHFCLGEALTSLNQLVSCLLPAVCGAHILAACITPLASLLSQPAFLFPFHIYMPQPCAWVRTFLDQVQGSSGVT